MEILVPIKLYSDKTASQVFSPDEMHRIQIERTKLAKSQGRMKTLLKIASDDPFLGADFTLPDAQGIPGLNDDPGFLAVAKNIGAGAIDILQRGNFVAAGLVDEMFVKKTGPIAWLGRVTKELFSGIGGIQGEKDTFRDILDSFDFANDKRLGDAIGAMDNVPFVGGFNLRGSLGLALDIALDPLTYLTGGGSALAKVPTKFISKVVGGSARRIAVTEGATQVFTKAGRSARQKAQREAFKEIKRDPRAVSELGQEAHRQAIEQVQDNLHAGLMNIGETAARAGETSADLLGALGSKVLGGTVSADKALEKALAALPGKTATQVRKALGLEKRSARSGIGEALLEQVNRKADDMLRTGIDQTGELSLLASEIAFARAVDSVLELAKEGGQGLLRDASPLRWQLTDKVGFNIGPAGKGLTEWIIQSEMSSKMIGALKKVLPDGAIGMGAVAATKFKDKLDVVGRMFNTAWDARKIRGYHTLRRANLDAIGAATGKNSENLKRTRVASWYASVIERTRGRVKERDAIFRRFAIAADTGNLSAIEKGAEMEALIDFKRIMSETVAVDIRKGLMQAQNVRRNYFPHFIDNPEVIVRKMVAQKPGRSARPQNSIGRFAEARQFDSIEDIERAADLANVKVRINFDPMLALTNRTNATIEGSLYQDFYRAAALEFGEKIIPLDPKIAFSIGEPIIDGASKAGRVVERLARNRKMHPGPDVLDRLASAHGDEAVGEFLRQRLIAVNNFKHLERFMRRYEAHMHNLPKLDIAPTKAADGTPMVEMAQQFGTKPGVGFNGYRVPQSVAESIQTMRIQTARSPEVDEILGMFDNFNNGLKVWLTALFPAFHFRNKYSNIAQNFLDISLAALNPIKSFRAARLYNMVYDGRNVLPRTPAKWLGPQADAMAYREIDGTVVTMEATARELRRNNVVRGHDEIFEGTRVLGRPPKGRVPLEGMKKTSPVTWKEMMKRKGTEVGGWIENEGRISLYVELRSRGLSESEAVARVNKLLFDYDSLTEFERVYLKRAIPFYVWTKKNVALQAEAFRNMPGRQAALVKPFFDTHQNDEDGIPLFDYELGQFRIIMDRNGRDVRMMTGIDLPIMSIDRILPIGQLVRGNFSAAYKSVAAQMNPLLRVPQEIAANQTFFDSRPLNRQQSQSIGMLLDDTIDGPGKLIPDSVRRWLGYKRTDMLQTGKRSYTFDGQKFYLLFRTWHISRVISSSDAWFKRSLDDTGTVANWFTMLTSFKDLRVNLDEKQRRVLDRRLDQIQDAMVRAGSVGELKRVFPLTDQPGKFKQTR